MIDAARLRITPWREIEVPLSMTLKGQHEAIQAAFLWFDAHLWEFEIDGRRYGLPFDDDFGDRVYKADVARLTKLRETGVTEFLHRDDMGENWEHRIEVLDLFAAEPDSRRPRFLRGQWRTPPEDVGGPPGFEMFLEAVADPNHPKQAHFLEWYDRPFDHDDIERTSSGS